MQLCTELAIPHRLQASACTDWGDHRLGDAAMQVRVCISAYHCMTCSKVATDV